MPAGGEDGGPEGGLVLRPAVHRQQRLHHVAQAQQEGEWPENADVLAFISSPRTADSLRALISTPPCLFYVRFVPGHPAGREEGEPAAVQVQSKVLPGGGFRGAHPGDHAEALLPAGAKRRRDRGNQSGTQ